MACNPVVEQGCEAGAAGVASRGGRSCPVQLGKGGAIEIVIISRLGFLCRGSRRAVFPACSTYSSVLTVSGILTSACH